MMDLRSKVYFFCQLCPVYFRVREKEPGILKDDFCKVYSVDTFVSVLLEAFQWLNEL